MRECKEQHTGLPWRVWPMQEKPEWRMLSCALMVISQKNARIVVIGSVGLVGNAINEANAALIVRAVNSHYRLLKALRSIERTAMRVGGYGVICQAVLTEARAAIASVESTERGGDAD